MIKIGEELGFGSTHDRAWNENLKESKIYLGIGGALIGIFGVLTIVGGCIKSKSDISEKCAFDNKGFKNEQYNESNQSLNEILKSLKLMFDENLINEEEYNKKREEMINRL